MLSFFFFNDTATTEIYTLSLHDALPISAAPRNRSQGPGEGPAHGGPPARSPQDRRAAREPGGARRLPARGDPKGHAGEGAGIPAREHARREGLRGGQAGPG